MESKSPMRTVDPQPMRNPSPSPSGAYPPYNPESYTPRPYNPQDYPPISGPPPSGPSPGLGPTPGLDDRPPSATPREDRPPQDRPLERPLERPIQDRPPLQERPSSRMDVQQKPASMAPVATTTETKDLKSLKTNCQFALREYLSLQRQRGRPSASTTDIDLETRIRNQGDILLGDLRTLQGELRSLAKKAESHRWRRWIIGGAIAGFIPLIRRFWRRGEDDESKESSNDTEYAFKKSQGLLAHIKNGVLGSGKFAKIAFMVFAVLYVFSNEVSLRVARTTNKRVKKLCARIERGDPDISESDMKVLEGWRWRVLLW